MSLSPELQKLGERVRPTIGERIDLSQNIYLLRKRMGWSQRELAKRAGITHANLCNYEQPVADMTLNTLQKLADVFGVKMADLLSPPRTNYTPTTTNYANWSSNLLDKGEGAHE